MEQSDREFWTALREGDRDRLVREILRRVETLPAYGSASFRAGPVRRVLLRVHRSETERTTPLEEIRKGAARLIADYRRTQPKTWVVTHSAFPGVTTEVVATSRAKARWRVVRTLEEYQGMTIPEALKGLRLQREEVDGA